MSDYHRTERARESSDDVSSSVRDAIAEFRRRNAVVIAWVRLGFHVALLPIVLDVSRFAPGPWSTAALVVRAASITGALAILLALRQRWQASGIIAGSVAFDVATLAISAWRSTHGMPVVALGAPALVLALAELILLFSALVLTERALLGLSVTVCAAAGLWSSSLNLSRFFALVATLAVTVFASAVIWAGRRVSQLVTERSMNAFAARVISTHRDELAEANAHLGHANRDLLEAQARAEMLTQLVVHDLKNPLAAVIAHIGVAHDAIATIPTLADEAEDLLIAKAESLRLSSMIGDLLLVSRLEQGDLKREIARVCVTDVLDAVRRAMQPQSMAKRVCIEVEAPSLLTASLDASLVRRLLENLVSNALRHTPPGGRIQLAARDHARNVQLAVRNTGAPIPAAQRSQLFEKYATRGRREWHNVGLGLYLCRLVAEAHGGHISLVDRPGWTVSFEAVLPASPG
jgi:signal transduction histidine kinase